MHSWLITHVPVIIVALPIFAALVAFITRNTSAGGVIVSITLSCISFASLYALYHVYTSGNEIIYYLGNWQPPMGIEYKIDALAAIFLSMISLSALMSYIWGFASTKYEVNKKITFFNSLYLLATAGLMGIVVTADAFNVFVFLEISSLSTYILISMGTRKESKVYALHYLMIGTVAATLYLFGIGILYAITGTLNMSDIARILPELASSKSLTLAVVCIFAGIIIKIALFPAFGWVAGIYKNAPSTASAFLAACAIKAAIYLLIRMSSTVLYTSSLSYVKVIFAIMFVVAFISIIVGAFKAFKSTDIGDILAYSSVSHVGYIILGIASGTVIGLTAAILHSVAHSIVKMGLFMSRGHILYNTGTVDITKIQGNGHKNPYIFVLIFISLMGIIGVPGTVGFISKYYLALSMLDTNNYIGMFIFILSSVASITYAFKIIESLWFRNSYNKTLDSVTVIKTSIMTMVFTVTVMMIIYFGLYSSVLINISEMAANNLNVVFQ